MHIKCTSPLRRDCPLDRHLSSCRGVVGLGFRRHVNLCRVSHQVKIEEAEDGSTCDVSAVGSKEELSSLEKIGRKVYGP